MASQKQRGEVLETASEEKFLSLHNARRSDPSHMSSKTAKTLWRGILDRSIIMHAIM